MKKGVEKITRLLQSVGLKATEARITLIATLEKQSVPISAVRIAELLEATADPVTVYRSLDTLVETGLVMRTDFRHGHAEFELAIDRPHHHHLVCTECGTVEDVTVCPMKHVNKRVLQTSKQFAAIDAHAFELFGCCKKCIA